MVTVRTFSPRYWPASPSSRNFRNQVSHSIVLIIIIIVISGLISIISLETILSGFVLPALSGILETVQIKFPELEPSVLTVISEIEASRKIFPRPPSGTDLVAASNKDKRDSISSLDSTQSGSDRMKEKVNKLFSKQSNIQFWKK